MLKKMKNIETFRDKFCEGYQQQHDIFGFGFFAGLTLSFVPSGWSGRMTHVELLVFFFNSFDANIFDAGIHKTSIYN